MTAANSRGEQKTSPRRGRRRALSALAAAGAWTVILTGAAPGALAADVQDKQWYLDAMQMDSVWKAGTGKGVKVAVVDTGVNPSTPALRGQVLPGKDMSGGKDGVDKDPDGHGTAMAELVAGTGKGGVKGIAPGSQILPFKANLEGVEGDAPVGDAVRAAVNSDAKIINLSFGGEYPTPELTSAVKQAVSKGKLVFAGTGNDAKTDPKQRYPAKYPDVVGVGATNKAGEWSDFSQYGDAVDLVAPGTDIPMYCDGEQQKYCTGRQGTSAATAIASGSAALIWSKHPDWTANQVLRVMFDTAGRAAKDDNVSKYIGHGEVRPRMNLVEGQGKPGDANLSPLTNKRVEPAKDSNSSASSGSSQSGSDSEKNNAAGKAQLADSKSQDNSKLWVITGGVVAAIVVIGAGAFALVRLRRN